MKRTLGWYLGDALWRITRRKTSVGESLCKLAKLYVAAYEDRGDEAKWNGEAELLHRLRKLAPTTIFDVGANIGDWTELALASGPEVKVHAFELSGTTAACLRNRFAQEARTIVNDFGLSDETGVFEFREYAHNPKLNTLLTAKIVHSDESVLRTARVMTGDDYCEENGILAIDLLKIDAEGVDYKVINGFEKLLSRRAIRLIQFEYGYAAVCTRFLVGDFVSFFEKFGYRVAPLRSQGIDLSQYSVIWNNFEFGPNFVAFKQDDAELIACCGRRE